MPNKILKVPDAFRYMSLDEVGECVSGITPDTYRDLWETLTKAKNPKPLGGDGSDGTTEEPIVSDGQYGTDLVAGWPHLKESSRENIVAAAEKKYV